jgi:NADPH:quinone reductase-like Zn-dependent oxidoreductase
VNSWDWDLLRGTPFMNRIGALSTPGHEILGADIAGRVEAVGRNVDEVRPGDEVFGDLSACGWGGFAEEVCARQDALAPKPDGLTFEQAAAVPQAGVLAWQGLHYGRPIEPGERVLINGAGGGAGTFAVQIAKSFGAEVTGVDSGKKLEMIRSIGADHVIDYTRRDFTDTGLRYDHIVDMTARHSIFDCRKALSADGTYVAVGASLGRTAQALLVGPLLSTIGNRKMGFLMHRPARKELEVLTGLLESGTVVPVIDTIYPLVEVPEALHHFGTGEVEGKLVIRVWTAPPA